MANSFQHRDTRTSKLNLNPTRFPLSSRWKSRLMSPEPNFDPLEFNNDAPFHQQIHSLAEIQSDTLKDNGQIGQSSAVEFSAKAFNSVAGTIADCAAVLIDSPLPFPLSQCLRG